MNYTFIVAAAGVGKRMGLGYPKQFLEHNGKPIFIYTLETIQKNLLVDEIIVVTNSEYIDSVREYIEKYKITKVKEIVAGGKERQDSVFNALSKAKGSFVAVQDGVRPFIKERYIDDCYHFLIENIDFDGIAVGVKAKDTIKLINDEGDIVETPERKNVINIHTPQVFRRETLVAAYKKAYSENFYGTDDSMLVERAGGRVRFYEGDYDNVKITTPEDMVFLNKDR